MTRKQIALSIVAGGVVANVLDFIFHGLLMGNLYAEQTALFRTDGSLLWLNLGDFVSVAVFVWVYQRVRSCFRGGAAGGAIFGLHAGVLIGFPTHIFLNLVIVDFGYGLAWAWTVHEIVWTVTVGAVVGKIAGTRRSGCNRGFLLLIGAGGLPVRGSPRSSRSASSSARASRSFGRPAARFTRISSGRSRHRHRQPNISTCVLWGRSAS